MHYANGREAKNGDKVVLFSSYSVALVGILYDAQAGNDYCNGKIAPIKPNDLCPNLKECLHLEDVLNGLPALGNVPDSSKAISVAGIDIPVDIPTSGNVFAVSGHVFTETGSVLTETGTSTSENPAPGTSNEVAE